MAFQAQKPSDLGLQLKTLFLKGQGVVTQNPGPAASSTRQFYSTHKGTDIGVPDRTPITPNFAGQYKSLGVQGGYGNRAAVYNPQEDRTYYLSHLSGMNAPTGNFQPGESIGYTGGTKGRYGSGNTTGPHLDVESEQGNTFAKLLSGIIKSVSKNSPVSGRQPKLDLSQMFGSARQKYGDSLRAISRNPNKLNSLAQKYGGRVFKI